MFAFVRAQGAGIAEARTVVVNTLVVLEIFYLFNVRFLKGSSLTWRGLVGTPAVLIAVGIVVALQLVFTYAPFMEMFFDTRPLTLVQWLQVIGVGIAAFLILEAEKRLWSQFAREKPAAGRLGGELGA